MSDESAGEGRFLRGVPHKYRRRGYRHTVSWAFYGLFIAVIIEQGPFVIRELGGTALQCLLPQMGQALPLVFALLWMPLLERRNPARLTGLLHAFGGLLIAFSGFCLEISSLVAVLTAGMLLSALSRPAMGTALQQVYPQQWRGKLLSLPNTSATLVRIVCLVVVGRLLRQDLGRYHWAFPIAGAALVVSGVLFRRVGGSRGSRTADGEPRPGILAQVKASVSSPLRNKVLLAFLICYFVTTCGSVAAVKVLPLFAKDKLALTTEQWGIALAWLLVAMLISYYPWGLFLDRFGAPVTVMVSWTLQCGIFAGLFFVHSWPTFLVLVAARGLFQAGNMLAFFPLVMHFTDPSETSRGMSLHFTLWGIRWVTMILFVALVVDLDLFPMRYIFLVGTALVGVGTAAMAVVWHVHRRREG